MNSALFVIFAATLVAGCASSAASTDSSRASREAAAQRPAPPITLAASPAIDESRTPARVDALWPQDEDGLSLNPTELHPDRGIGDKVFRTDQQSALTGDKDAAVRVARMFQRGTNNVPRDERRMVQWLRRASDLKHGSASYELYLYYLERGLDREALRYEKRALDQGFTPPPRLDPRRG